MTQFIAKITLITAMSVSITGCAQISFVGDNLWGVTKSATNFVTQPVASLLRSAPRHDYVFDRAPAPYQNIAAQHQVKTAFASDGVTDKHARLVVPKLNQLPVPQTQNYRYAARRPYNDYHANQYHAPEYQTSNMQPAHKPSYRSVHKPRQVALTPRRIVKRQVSPQHQAQLKHQNYTQTTRQAENQSQNNQEISFVKIGGGSNMSDWTSCQKQSGSYYQMTQTSYRIDPSFENCMRGKGYKPESEAKAELRL